MAKKIIDINEVRDEKQARRSFLTGRFVILIVFLAALAIYGGKSVQEIQNLKQTAAAAKAELTIKEEQKANLEKEFAAVKTPQNIERQARNRLRMVKPGETIYIYKDAVSPEEAASDIAPSDAEE